MAEWIRYASVAIFLWGIVGLLQKMGASRVSSHSLIVWVTAGFVMLLPWFLMSTHLAALSATSILIGIGVGVINGLGSWFLFAALERGALATVAIPLTALYPIVTVVLAVTFLDEALTARQWVGLALAIAAAALLSYETPDAA